MNKAEKKARNEGNRLLANQNYGKKMDNLSKALYCTLRAEGIGKDEASFILKKFRNITPQNQEGSNVNYRPGKRVKSVPDWYSGYMADVRTTAEENRNKKASSDQSIDQMLKEFDELK